MKIKYVDACKSLKMLLDTQYSPQQELLIATIIIPK